MKYQKTSTGAMSCSSWATLGLNSSWLILFQVHKRLPRRAENWWEAGLQTCSEISYILGQISLGLHSYFVHNHIQIGCQPKLEKATASLNSFWLRLYYHSNAEEFEGSRVVGFEAVLASARERERESTLILIFRCILWAFSRRGGKSWLEKKYHMFLTRHLQASVKRRKMER